MTICGEAGKLQELGFVADPTADAADKVFCIRQACSPELSFGQTPRESSHCESIRSEPSTSPPSARFHRRSAVREIPALPCQRIGNGRLEIIERRGDRGYVPELGFYVSARNEAKRLWSNCPRTFKTDTEGFQHTDGLLDQLVDSVGRDLACAIVFEEARAYWQGRNRAGQVQKARQDALGLGWQITITTRFALHESISSI